MKNNKFRRREIDNQNRRFSVHTFYAPGFHQKMHFYLQQPEEIGSSKPEPVHDRNPLIESWKITKSGEEM
jgi:hypothetical protein